jgi:hypothetical protein
MTHKKEDKPQHSDGKNSLSFSTCFEREGERIRVETMVSKPSLDLIGEHDSTSGNARTDSTEPGYDRLFIKEEDQARIRHPRHWQINVSE